VDKIGQGESQIVQGLSEGGFCSAGKHCFNHGFTAAAVSQ